MNILRIDTRVSKIGKIMAGLHNNSAGDWSIYCFKWLHTRIYTYIILNNYIYLINFQLSLSLWHQLDEVADKS